MNLGQTLIAGLVAVSALIAACRDDEDQTVNSKLTVQIMPLKIGNQWNFCVTRTDSLGDTTRIDTSVIYVCDDTIIQGVIWYPYLISLTQPPTDLSMMANKSDGLWLRGPDSTDLPYLLAKYPATVGDTWTDALGLDTFSILALNVSVDVPAGAFECVQYTIRRASGDSTYNYFAPGVGLVEQRFIASGDKSLIVTELIGMSLR